MKDEFVDRLLDEGLKNYSRVEAAEDLAERAAERVRSAARDGRPGSRPRWLIWAPVFAVALVVVVGALVWRAGDQRRVSTPGSQQANAPQPTPAVPPRTEQPSETLSSRRAGRTAAASAAARTFASSQTQVSRPARPAARQIARYRPPVEVESGRHAGIVGSWTVSPKGSLRVLTAEEIAELHLTADMLARPAAELTVPDLKVTPLRVAPITTDKPDGSLDPSQLH